MSHLQRAREARLPRQLNSNHTDEKNEKNEISPNRPRARLTPSHCLGPRVCAVVGCCGRLECLAPRDVIDWMDAVDAARSPDNPHRVPEFDPIEEESEIAA